MGTFCLPNILTYGHERDEVKLRRNVLMIFGSFTVLYAVLLLVSVRVTRADDLLSLFDTDTFSGSIATLKKYAIFNKIGGFLNLCISAFSFLGLVLICFQRMVTLLYKSSQTTFDHIHDMKKNVSSKEWLGFKGIFTDNIQQSKNGIGLDGVVNFLLYLLPDVREYSDYSEASQANGEYRYGLQDSDTISTYILRVSIPTVMAIFFFSMGFNGMLFQAYGMVVKGMTAAADEFVNIGLDSYVERLIASGSAYKFSYDADGSNIGKLQQGIAKDVYSKAIKRLANPGADANMYVGAAVDRYLQDNLFGTKNDDGSANSKFTERVNAGLTNKWDGTDLNADNIEYTVVMNASGTEYSASDVVIPLSEISGGQSMLWYSSDGQSSGDSDTRGNGSSAEQQLYVHVVFNKKADSVEQDFINVDTSNSKGAGSSKN